MAYLKKAQSWQGNTLNSNADLKNLTKLDAAAAFCFDERLHGYTVYTTALTIKKIICLQSLKGPLDLSFRE